MTDIPTEKEPPKPSMDSVKKKIAAMDDATLDKILKTFDKKEDAKNPVQSPSTEPLTTIESLIGPPDLEEPQSDIPPDIPVKHHVFDVDPSSIDPNAPVVQETSSRPLANRVYEEVKDPSFGGGKKPTPRAKVLVNSSVDSDLANILKSTGFESTKSEEDLIETVESNLQLMEAGLNRETAPLKIVDALYELYLLGVTKKPELADILKKVSENPAMKIYVRNLLKQALDDYDKNKIKKYMAVGTDLKLYLDPQMATFFEALMKFVEARAQNKEVPKRKDTS